VRLAQLHLPPKSEQPELQGTLLLSYYDDLIVGTTKVGPHTGLADPLEREHNFDDRLVF
jgi:hypothetical protein